MVDSVVTDRKVTPPVIHRLVMHPRDERSSVRRILVYVHGERWTPERIEIPQPGGSMMKAAFVYQNVSGFWLPSQLTVTFATGTTDTRRCGAGQPVRERAGRAYGAAGRRTQRNDHREVCGLPRQHRSRG